MASVINTNVASLNSQRNLASSQASLATSIQRLSTGLRINSAKDDAAGLAISERFSSQIRGLNQATRNANDGISLTQTAEGAMSQISDNLQRVRELAVQSANSTNSKTDREAMQKEVTALLAEIDRVAGQTEFNGTKLLDGSFSGQQIQVGANAGQTIGIKEILSAKTSELGKASYAADVTITIAAGDTAADKTYGSMKINGTTLDEVKVAKGAEASVVARDVAAAINAKSGETGVIALFDKDDTTKTKLTLVSTKAGEALAYTAGTETGALSLGTIAAAATESRASTNIDISTEAGSQKALSIVDKALEKVNSARADMGAIQNRFTSVIANLQSSTENLSASQSRIRDTDYASETAQMTRNQILQQAGTAMLAQANSLPQSVLSLLG